MLGLDAAAEAGVQVCPETLALATRYWTAGRNKDRGWASTTVARPKTANMTRERVSALILARTHRGVNVERAGGGTVRDCGKGIGDHMLHSGIDWLAIHFGVKANDGDGFEWRFHYLESLARVGQLTGVVARGSDHRYLEGAASAIESDSYPLGRLAWDHFREFRGAGDEFCPHVPGPGRTPILSQKAMRMAGEPTGRTTRMTSGTSSRPSDGTGRNHWAGGSSIPRGRRGRPARRPGPVPQRPPGPLYDPGGKEALRGYVERGGLIFAEACWRAEFDKGIRTLVRNSSPIRTGASPGRRHLLPVWHSLHDLDPRDHPLWGMARGGRTARFTPPATSPAAGINAVGRRKPPRRARRSGRPECDRLRDRSKATPLLARRGCPNL